MVALTTDRNTPKRERRDIEAHPVAAGVTIFAGSLVCLNAAGFAIPGATAVGLIPVGRAEARVIGDGVRLVTTRRGVMCFANSASTDLIARSEIGDPAYIVDDQTLAKTSATNTRSVAGTIRDVDARGVWVEI